MHATVYDMLVWYINHILTLTWLCLCTFQWRDDPSPKHIIPQHRWVGPYSKAQRLLEMTRCDTKTVIFVTKKVPRFVAHIYLSMIDDICRACDTLWSRGGLDWPWDHVLLYRFTFSHTCAGYPKSLRNPNQTISHPQSPAPMHVCRFQFAPKAFHSFPEVNISLSTIAAGLHFWWHLLMPIPISK